MTDYLNWQSDLTLEQVFAASDPFSYPDFSSDSSQSQLVYLSNLNKENGRAVLMLEGNDKYISPKPFNLRTKISEYGGKPYWLHGDEVIFANQSDQCLYRQSLRDANEKPERISPVPGKRTFMYSDVIALSDTVLLAIVEQEVDGVENQSFIARLDPSQPDTAPQILVDGADFYSNLVVDVQAKRLAWVQWNHPNMPWDSNQAWVADFEIADGHDSINSAASKNDEVSSAGLGITNIQITDHHQIELEDSACVCQLFFASNGRLFFSADFAGAKLKSSKNFWNIFSYSCADKIVSPVTELNYEFGYPHWIYGDSRIAQYDANTLLTIGSAPEGDILYAIDQDSLAVQVVGSFSLDHKYTLRSLVADGNSQAAMVLLKADQTPDLITLSGNIESVLVNNAIRSPEYKDTASLADHFEFPTRDGEQAFGFYYPPLNDSYSDVDLGPPPLIVMVHGGPTSRAYGYFDIQKQFWTSRGFAIFDVNHRGSSGYGRHYRDALYEQWGERDAADIIDGLQHLIEQGQADPKRLCIRGKSAGGYAVLRALTEYPEVFKAGACYYGIGNLSTLAEVTHKFEKFYTDRLVGEQYTAAQAAQSSSAFYQRSPINKIAELRSAMIVFQGLQDKIVPPTVAREVISALKAADLEHSYVEYAEEGHGFRQAANNIDAWGKELAFYRKVLN